VQLTDRLASYRAEEDKLSWHGTFAQYFDLVVSHPEIARLSHARLHDMILHAGITTHEKNKDYHFFHHDLFGVDKPLQQLVDYFSSSARRLEVRKRILLLMGPVGGGKSTIVTLLKRGLERYSRTDAGAVYAIKDCPMHEEPLHLIPESLRIDVLKEYGMYIEGDLCPVCQQYLIDHDNAIENVPVERITFSEKKRIGVGTFAPSDEKCVAGDTLVLTSEGMQRFEDLYLGLTQKPARDAFVDWKSGVYGCKGIDTTTQFYYGGKQSVYHVETQFGLSLRGTHNHRLLTIDSTGTMVWKRIGDLVTNQDYVAIARKTEMWGNTTYIDTPDYPMPMQPTEITRDFAYWLGLLVSEGSLAYHDVWFTNANDNLIEQYVKISREIFGVDAKVYHKEGIPAKQVAICNTAICRWLRSEIGLATGAGSKFIPACILKAPRHIVIAFLEGLFWGDASLRGRPIGSNILTYSSKSHRLASEVQIILLNLGIVGSLIKAPVHDVMYYRLDVHGDAVLDLVSELPSLRKMATSPLIDVRTEKTNYDVIPFGDAFIANGAGDKNLKRIERGERGLTYVRARETYGESPYRFHSILSDILETNYLWVMVEKIESAGEEMVYDLTVPENHSFTGNGFVQHNSQDISELTGSMDLSTIAEYGSESDPRAYRFDGELNVANRGMMEFVEMLKASEKFLYGLLTLSQEQAIKTSRFAMMYADEVIVAHTNEHEYAAFVANKKSEALQDRIIVIKVPYNLRLSDEVKIYQKLLVESAIGNVHIAPGTLSVVSTFAILSRLEAPKKAGMSLQKKMRLYDGDVVEGFNEQDLREVRAETIREGMDGISPRYVINRLSQALIKDNLQCLHPIDALRALRDGFEQHTSINREERDRLLNLIAEARKEYDDFAKSEVQRAFVYSFEESARTLLNNYLDNVEAFCNKTKIKDPLTEDPVDPDEKLMRSIEEQIGITDSAKKAFREEILIRLSALARRGIKFEYRSHEKLKEAIEKKLFGDLKDIVKITTSTKTPDADQLRKINDVVDRLISHEGYCAVCANEMLKYVGTLLAR
jgi:predicted Ser/Thr protein kinase